MGNERSSFFLFPSFQDSLTNRQTDTYYTDADSRMVLIKMTFIKNECTGTGFEKFPSSHFFYKGAILFLSIYIGLV